VDVGELPPGVAHSIARHRAEKRRSKDAAVDAWTDFVMIGTSLLDERPRSFDLMGCAWAAVSSIAKRRDFLGDVGGSAVSPYRRNHKRQS
jgi:hypothetical protein